MDPGGDHSNTKAATGSGAKTRVGDVLVADDSPILALSAAIDGLFASGLRPASGNDAGGVLKALEREARRLHAATVEAMAQIDAAGLHRSDGHASAQIQARHVARLSNGEASNRAKTMRMLPALPLIKQAFWEGEIGIDQVHLLARVYANKRVRGAMELRQGRFIEQAATLPYALFETRLREWERLIDEDGPEPPSQRTHRNRTARLTQDSIDLGWELMARFAAMQGMAINEIWGHYIDAEWHADWEKAVAEYGDNASVADMARTDAQRRADALWQVFQDAAGADGSATPPGYTHNIVWTADTYEEMLRRLDGDNPQPIDADTYTCETIDGVPLEPTQAATNSLLHCFRRLVVNAQGVTLDQGRRRYYTGPLRDAVMIQSGGRCIWPGCALPASKCQADHVLSHTKGGLTNPGNGAPLSGRHNRLKEHGYHVWRDPTGLWHTYRPDGTEIEN